MTVNTKVIQLFLDHQMDDYVPLAEGLQLQVLPSMSYLPRCRRHHFAAFVREQRLLVVWDDEPTHLLQRAEHIETSLLTMIWGKGEKVYDGVSKEKESANVMSSNVSPEMATPSELEEARLTENRPTVLINPFVVALTLTLLISALGLGWRNLAQECAVDGGWVRLALLVVTPAQIFVSLVSYFSITEYWRIPANHLSSSSKLLSLISPK